MASIYLLEDDPAYAQMVAAWLSDRGHAVSTFELPHEFFYAASKRPPRCAVIDWRLPEMEGVDVVARLRRQWPSGLGIVMLTAMDQEHYVVQALAAGADDYIAKPAARAVTVARIEALLRRLAPPAASDDCIDAPPYRFEFAIRKAMCAGRVVNLSPREFDLASALFREPHRLFTREELLAAVWGKEKETGGQTLVQHIYAVRKKLALLDHGYRIVPVYGSGYRLEVQRAGPADALPPQAADSSRQG